MGLLSGDVIRRSLRILNSALANSDQPKTRLIVVGGSALALLGLRDSTRDIDVVRALEDRVTAAVARLAPYLDLPADWLNSHASPFMPRDFEERRCTFELRMTNIDVLVAHPDDLFVMKLNASRGQSDFADLIRLWPLCSFGSEVSALERFAAAYPDARTDEFLEQHIRLIRERARAGG
jgi:hypothetical protein